MDEGELNAGQVILEEAVRHHRLQALAWSQSGELSAGGGGGKGGERSGSLRSLFGSHFDESCTKILGLWCPPCSVASAFWL